MVQFLGFALVVVAIALVLWQRFSAAKPPPAALPSPAVPPASEHQTLAALLTVRDHLKADAASVETIASLAKTIVLNGGKP